MAIMFDIKEGATDVITGKCFVQPRTELTKESMAKGSAIEIECSEIPECKNKACVQPFEIEAEVLYEPFKYEREALRVEPVMPKVERKKLGMRKGR